ncbi:tetratricopeptide repeat protein, partial [bacterium AH-315-O15]|nr:tetratricopeptide repeat protein [bacterium AH-315-O15]
MGDTMRKFSSRAILGCVVALSFMVIGCGQVANLRAKMAFREANTLYQAQDWVLAVEKYEEVAAMNPTDPQLLTTYFFLGNSYDNQYSPGRQNDPVNDALLTKAIDNYKRAVEVLTDNPDFRTLSLQYLVAAYGPDKLNDPAQAEPLLRDMIRENPDNPPTYFLLSRLYEDNGDYENAEATLIAGREARPGDASVYTTLAAYYDRQGNFDMLIQTLEARTAQEPNNPEAFYTIATYYFNKASRDFSLSDSEKVTYADAGVVAVDKAIALNENYMEALVFKNLFLRLQANLDSSPARQQALLEEAD